MRKLTAILIISFLLAVFPSSVRAGSTPGPVRPHSPLAARQRAQTILNARMAEIKTGSTSHALALEVGGDDYLITLSSGGESVVHSNRSGVNVGNGWVAPRSMFFLSVASYDGGDVWCRIYDSHGGVLSAVDGGNVATCSARGW